MSRRMPEPDDAETQSRLLKKYLLAVLDKHECSCKPCQDAWDYLETLEQDGV